MRGLDDDADGPGRSEEMRPDERLHDERIGNIRGLDDDADGPGRSEEMRPDERLHDERIGNVRGLDDDVTTRDDTTRDDTTDEPAADETTGEKPSLLDRAKGRVDDALGRRDTDDDGRRD